MTPAAEAGRPGAVGWDRRRVTLAVAVAAAVIVADQLSKDWALSNLVPGQPRHILGPANFVLTFNRGAAFSLGSGVAPVVEAVAVTLVLGLVLASRRLARNGVSMPMALSVGLLGGGALSNLGDRFVRHHHGAVVDFVQVVSWWPVFNVADTAITVGAIALALTVALA
jgi:signal peptidase II